MYKISEKKKHYLKLATMFGVIGWGTFFLAGFLVAIGQDTTAIFVGAFSIFIGWFVSGYFWLRLGLWQGKNIKEMILHRKK
ncbi:MAG: hypothetical protein ACHQX1_02825 [Candidatus Micrarchaeales archaeon]